MKHTQDQWKELYNKMSDTYDVTAPAFLEGIRPLYENIYPGFSVEPYISLENYPPHIQIHVAASEPVTNNTKKLVASKFRQLTEIVNKIANEHGLKRKTIDGYDGLYIPAYRKGNKVRFHRDDELTYLTLVFK